MLNLPVLKAKQSNDLKGFIRHWNGYYQYPKEHLYEASIHKEQLTPEDIENLFLWKNGIRLSKAKKLSLHEKILKQLDTLNRLKTGKLPEEEFFSTFQNLGAVWKIFLLHLTYPTHYPIYDQNVHRAYLYIHNQDYQVNLVRLPDKQKEDFYFEKYVPFINNIAQDLPLREVDKGLFAFGRVLNGPLRLFNGKNFGF